MTYTRRFADTWLRSLEFQVDAYYNEVENKIVATPTSNFFRWTMVNLGEVEIRGVDAALQTDWQVGKEWFFTGRLNYTYQRAQDFTDPSSEFTEDRFLISPGTAVRQPLTHAGVPGKPATVLFIRANAILRRPIFRTIISCPGIPAIFRYRRDGKSGKMS